MLVLTSYIRAGEGLQAEKVRNAAMDEQTHIRQLFSDLDQDKAGFLTMRDLLDIGQVLGLDQIPTPQGQEILKEMKALKKTAHFDAGDQRGEGGGNVGANLEKEVLDSINIELFMPVPSHTPLPCPASSYQEDHTCDANPKPSPQFVPGVPHNVMWR